MAAQDPCVLTIGKFAGGQTPNIIPEKVVLEEQSVTKIKKQGIEFLKEFKKFQICVPNPSEEGQL